MLEYTDVQIRIRAAKKDTPARYPVEAQIEGSGLWRGESDFDFDKLDLGGLTKRDYGILLGQQLMNASITRALEHAGAGQNQAVRIRLVLDEEVEQLHRIRWERMYLPVGKEAWNVAISPTVPFSRYIEVERRDSAPLNESAFRLLLAIANPSDLDEDQKIDVEDEVASLFARFGAQVPTTRFQVSLLPGQTPVPDELKAKVKKRWGWFEGPATLDNISKALHADGGYHALHIICHGNYISGDQAGVLFLENDEGKEAEIQARDLQSWIHPRLQLIVFQACRTAAAVAEGDPPFAGTAPTMVKSGVPAVIAMQDFVEMGDARDFSSAFYQALLRDGYVDAAVNEGRRQIVGAVGRAASTIPALFMRLQDGKLWQPDPVRGDVWDRMKRIRPSESLPLKVVHHSRGLDFDPMQGPEGPIYELRAHVDKLVDSAWLTCLTGPPGFDKTGELSRQYLRLADLYLQGKSDHSPFLLPSGELLEWSRSQADSATIGLRDKMRDVAQRKAVPPELTERCFVFLVLSDRELAEEAANNAIDALLQLLGAFPGSRALLVYDQNALRGLKDRLPKDADVQVLVVRPMEWPTLRAYLLKNEQDLVKNLEGRQITDLASAPWLLAQLRRFPQKDHFPPNRAQALRLIFNYYLADINTNMASRACAEQALEEIAWEIQSRRARGLENSDLLPILSRVRAKRDFRLSDLRQELIRVNILAPWKEEGARFSYSAVQAYCTAQYLNKSPKRMELLEDITAALGRFTRIRQWENVLIILAGLVETDKERVALLQAILAGSSLAEGEQAFLAVCMYTEMKGAQICTEKVVKQIVDALIWRSRPDIPRPYADRRLAAMRLSEMGHPDAIRHLISLAVDKFAIASGNSDHGGLPPPEAEAQPATEDLRRGRQRFDNAGIRFTAVKGLLRQAEATQKYVNENRPDLKEMVDAWWKLYDEKPDTGPIIRMLNADDPKLSPVAAFALAQLGMEIGGPPLVDTYFYFEKNGRMKKPNSELLWAITEVFGRQDAAWLEETVILRWLKANPEPNRRLCYLIQRLGNIRSDSPVIQYLDKCLAEEKPTAHDRALRAYSKLNEPGVNDWLIPLCQNIVAGEWKGVLSSGHVGLKTEPKNGDAWKLQQSALEVLRDIGGEDSINVIRDSRLNMDPVLFQLSFQVSEEIYWRLTGGLTREKFD